MLFVLSKDKIISYAIAFSTVAILLFFSIGIAKEPESVSTSANAIQEHNVICGE